MATCYIGLRIDRRGICGWMLDWSVKELRGESTRKMQDKRGSFQAFFDMLKAFAYMNILHTGESDVA